MAISVKKPGANNAHAPLSNTDIIMARNYSGYLVTARNQSSYSEQRDLLGLLES
jgi:hypothetical protein